MFVVQLTEIAMRYGATIEDVAGFIPFMLDDNDPRPAREQFDENYQHGGGWRVFKGFEMLGDNSIQYPEDTPLPALVKIDFRDEVIFIYPDAWVAIVQKDGSFEICRMD